MMLHRPILFLFSSPVGLQATEIRGVCYTHTGILHYSYNNIDWHSFHVMM